MLKDNHIVITTINKPVVLYELLSNLEIYGHLDSTLCWVVGDYKTPNDCGDICADVSNKGFEVNYLDIDKQKEWGKLHSKFYEILPYNNETRRNIGYLHALEAGCKRLICLDDDNFPGQSDFIGGHLSTGMEWSGEQVYEKHGFHNVCEYLTFNSTLNIYPRGYPFKSRTNGSCNSNKFINDSSNTVIGVKSGLWTGAPDLDATTWLNGKIESQKFLGKSDIVLSESTWSPINTQNTSVIRELIPAYFCIPMGQVINGIKIERYGDIWAGYILQAILKGTEFRISFGHPIVRHERNTHNYLSDLSHEFLGIILTDWLIDKLKNDFVSSADSIIDRMNELSEFLEGVNIIDLPEHVPDECHSFLLNTATGIRRWLKVCSSIL